MDDVLDASVIVATRNRPQLLSDLLSSLERSRPEPAEVVVVDDASSTAVDNLRVGTGRTYELRVIRNDKSIGPGASRNRGVHASRGNVLLFTDDDCVVEPSWAGALCSALAGAANTELGGVGGKVLARDRDLFSRYFEHHRILEPRPHDSANPRRIPYLVTANCAIPRDVFMRAGGFDGRIPAAGGEDAAISMRILKQGRHFEQVADAVVHHRFRVGISEFARTFYRYGLGGRYVVDRYLPG